MAIVYICRLLLSSAFRLANHFGQLTSQLRPRMYWPSADMPSCTAYVCFPKADLSGVFGVKVLEFAVINRGRDSMLQTPMFLHWFLVRRRPPRGYGRSQRISFFETMPSRPSLQTGLNICLPSPSVCSTN